VYKRQGKDLFVSNMVISSECPNLIRSISESQADEKNPSDVAKEPHILSHSIDSIRYLLSNRPAPSTGSTTSYGYDEEDFLDEEDRNKVGGYYDS